MFSKFALLVLLLLVALPVHAQTATPTPPVTLQVTVPRAEMNSAMATAAAGTNNLPDEIQRPGGTSLIPSVDLTQLFAYAKWLFSLNTANELLGRTFAPIGMELMIIFTFTVILTILYFIINIIALIIKGVIWVINQILKIIPFW